MTDRAISWVNASDKFTRGTKMEQHEQITIAEYQTTAASFREGTWDHDVSQNRFESSA
jgi:hypothetical protein